MKRTLATLAVIASLFIIGAVPASAAAVIKFTICHATSSESNPYTTIKVPEGSSLSPHLSDNEGNNPLAGHEQDLLFEGDVDCPGGPTEPPVTDPPTEPPPTEPPPTEPPPTEPPPTEPPPTEPPPTEPPLTEPPVVEEFAVDVCPLTGEPVAALVVSDAYAYDVAVIGDDIPDGLSAIRFRHPILAILLLTIRVDGEPVTLDGDGVVIVQPGVHTWSISNAADTEVLAEGVIDCPVCNPTAVTNPPDDVTNPPKKTLPPTDTLGSASETTDTGFAPVLLMLAGIIATGLWLTRKRA